MQGLEIDFLLGLRSADFTLFCIFQNGVTTSKMRELKECITLSTIPVYQLMLGHPDYLFESFYRTFPFKNRTRYLFSQLQAGYVGHL